MVLDQVPGPEPRSGFEGFWKREVQQLPFVAPFRLVAQLFHFSEVFLFFSLYSKSDLFYSGQSGLLR